VGLSKKLAFLLVEGVIPGLCRFPDGRRGAGAGTGLATGEEKISFREEGDEGLTEDG